MKHHLWRACAPAFALALIASIWTAPAWAAGAAAIRTPDEARVQLEAAARAHMERVIRTLRPNRADKEVTRHGTAFVARYQEVDAERMSAELINDRAQDGVYVGQVVYVVHEYRCTGATRQQALDGPCQVAKSRRIRELTSYVDGKWQL